MPIVHVRGRSDEARAETSEALAHIATAVAAATGSALTSVWCTFQELSVITIGEKEADDPGILYLDLLMKPRGELVESDALEAAARAAAESFQVPPEDVWARLTVLKSGTVYAGGSRT